MIHLLKHGSTWCEDDEPSDRHVEDPRDATCAPCLRRASAYGAAAAMRGAAVEAGATQDPELVRERDEAVRMLGEINAQLERRDAFFCTDCEKLHHVSKRGLNTGAISWCAECAPHGGRA